MQKQYHIYSVYSTIVCFLNCNFFKLFLSCDVNIYFLCWSFLDLVYSSVVENNLRKRNATTDIKSTEATLIIKRSETISPQMVQIFKKKEKLQDKCYYTHFDA